MGVWDELEQKIEVDYVNSLGGYEVLKPKPEDLDLYERMNGFKFPNDYREFALTFGPGTFGAGWQFATPGFPGDSNIDFNLRANKGDDVNRDCFFICGKEDFHGWLGWDPKDVTDPDTHEYGIYLFGHEDNDAPHKVASTFHNFIVSYIFGGGFEREEEPWEPAKPTFSERKRVGFSQVILINKPFRKAR